MATYTSQPDETSGMDTFIDAANATSNYGSTAYIAVGENATNTDLYRTLIKFDLSTIPKNSTITSATLSLWTYDDLSTNARTFYVYRQLKEWWEGSATWNIWRVASNWGTAGGFDSTDCETTDIGSAALGAAESTDTEIQFVLDPAKVQEWVDGTLTNNGMLIKNDTELNDAYRFHSSASATAAFRPKLVIEYAPLGNVTTLTASIDTKIYSASAATNYGTDTTFKVGENNSGVNEVNRALIKFDLSTIPPGATVNRARVRMVTQGDDSNNNRSMKFYRTLRAWVEGEATWNIWKTGTNWLTAGGFDSSDCEQTDIGSYTLTAAEYDGRYIFIELTTSDIQEMVTGTFTNNGFLLKNDTETDDAVVFYSSEAVTTEYRPILYLDWSGGGQVFIWTDE